jgi:TRAP-type uncharacterized transport system fused permease subunit
MKKLHELVSKKQWFILFNLGALVALALSGRLTSSRASLITSLIALLIVNVMAVISAKNYPEWK